MGCPETGIDGEVESSTYANPLLESLICGADSSCAKAMHWSNDISMMKDNTCKSLEVTSFLDGF